MTSAGHSGRPRRHLLLTVLVVLFIGWMTLNPVGRPSSEPMAPFFCLLACDNQSVRDLISNIILFIPLGWVLSYWTSPRRAIAIAVLATMAIELSQALFLPARDPSFRDILTNAAGGAIGVWLYHDWRTILFPTESRAVRLAATSLLLSGTIIGLTLAGLHPSPSDRTWFGQWAPDLGHYDRYPGTLISVVAGGVRPSDGRLENSDPIRNALTREQFSVEVTAVSGSWPLRPAPIFAVHDDERHEQLMIGQRYRSLQFQLRTRFDDWELRGLRLRLPIFPGRDAGDTIVARGSVTRGYWHLSVTGRAGSDSVSLPLSAGLGWAGLLPFNYPIWKEWVLFNPFWLALLFAPAGYWLGRVPGRRALLYGGATGALLLALLPLFLGGAPTQWPEWIGSATGFLSSSWLAGRLRAPPTT